MTTELENIIESIKYTIINSYQSYYYLKQLIKYEPSKKLAFYHYPYLDLFNYLVRDFKTNICSNIWKIYIDKNAKAITLRKLNNILYKEKQIEFKLATTFCKKFEKPIDKIRKQSIAHNDLEKEDYLITLNDMFDVLNEIKNNFNKMLNEIKNNYNEISTRFSIFCSPITDKDLEKIKNESEVTMEMIFSGDIKKLLT